MYHDLPAACQFLVVPFHDRPRPCGDCPQARVSVRRTPALCQLPPEAPGRSRSAPRDLAGPDSVSAAIATVAGSESHRRRCASSAAKVYLGAVVLLISAMRQGPIATPSPRALRALRRRPADHRSLAGLLARALSPDSVLEASPAPVWQPVVKIVATLPLWTLARPPSPGTVDPGEGDDGSRTSADCSRHGWERLLRFLAPITITGGLRIEVS